MYTYADKLMEDAIFDVLNTGYMDISPRPRWKDGVPAHTLSVNHVVRRYNLYRGDFPILTLRRMPWKWAIAEILWIYQDASNDLSVFHEKYGNHVWDDWNIGDGTIGFRYGHTVNRYQLMQNLLTGLKEDPFGRRHIIDLWQESEFAEDTKGLKPCAFCTIWNVRNDERGRFLDMMLIQRSGDMIAASGPGGYNEIQYAALQMMVARHCGYIPGVFTHVVGNEHIYDRHRSVAEALAERMEKIGYGRMWGKIPLEINPEVKDFYDMKVSDFTIPGYKPIEPQLKFEVAI